MRDQTLESAGVQNLKAGLTASAASIAWTACSSAAAITFGMLAGSIVLVAFGAVGVFDMCGSIALVLHFRHAIRHESFSERHEAVALRLVTFGLAVVGLATLAASILRLVRTGHTTEPVGGIVVAGCSIVVLGFLGVRKRRLGRVIPSPALVADGWLSLIGGGTAAGTVVGLVLNKTLDWSWPDPVAAMVVAVAALAVAAANLRSLRSPRGARR
ncbi:MAG TPA: cation transporter [Mycobacteriales bacterium]|nr:cation transporter [Mycobacteriales bacterium]